VGANEASLDRLVNAEGPEEFEEAWERVVENFDKFFVVEDSLNRLEGALLRLAVSGKLFHGNGSAYEAPQMIDKVRNAKAAALARGFPKVTGTEFPVSNEEIHCVVPDHWVWTRPINICEWIVDGTHHTPSYTVAGVPFLSATNVRDGALSFDNCKYIALEAHKQLRKRCCPRRGSVLFTKSGTIGNVAVVETDMEFSLFESVAVLTPLTEELNPRFLAMAVKVFANGEGYAHHVKGAAVKHFHLKDLRQICIPLPPPTEQNEIVLQVNGLLSVIAELKRRLREVRSIQATFSRLDPGSLN